MRRVLAVWAALIGMAACLLCPATASAATPAVTLSPTTGHPSVTTTVTGSGFGASEAVDVYFDTTDELLAVTSSTGGFSVSLTVPASAQPGVHWVTAVGRADGLAAQAKFTVRTNWPEFGGLDARNQRYNPFENTLTPATVSGLDEAWQFTTGGGIYSSAAVVNGIVYVGSQDGKVYAINEATGAQKWTFTTGGAVYSSPAVVGGTLYVGSSNGHVYAVNATTGVGKWDDDLSSLETVEGFVGSPTVSSGTVYIGGTSGNLYFLNASTGFARETVPTSGPIRCAPAVANGRVFVRTEDEKLYAFDTATGAAAWTPLTLDSSSASGGAVMPGPALANGRVFTDSLDSNVWGVGQSDDNRFWVTSTGSGFGFNGSPAAAGGVVYANDRSGNLVALNAKNGASLWSVSAGAEFISSPLVAGGVVYASDAASVVEAFRASDGSLLWSAGTGGVIGASPTVSDGSLYIGSTDGILHAYTLTTFAAAARPAPARLHPNLKLQPAR